MKLRPLLLILGFAAVALIGYRLADTAAPRKPVAAKSIQIPEKTVSKAPVDDEMPKFRRGNRLPASSRDLDAALAGALEGQRVLVFKDQESLAAFLERAGDSIRVMGRLDALNALRIGFDNYDDLLALLDGDEEESFIFPVNIPDLPEGSVQPGAVALGSYLLQWLGITGDNSSAGAGVLIAILDTGVAAHSAFTTKITSINLVPLPADVSTQNGHGTAMASMIVGNDPLTPGVAPSAWILDYRVADDLGQSDGYLIAQGIIAAVDAGADVISISMGGFGDNAIVRKAKEYANEKGVLIIAAAGNNGINQVALPGGYPGVTTVGAVDALGNPLNFSNTGDSLDIAAPGYAINAAWPGEQVVSVSGTSPATAIVSGAVAKVMSEKKISGESALQEIVTYTKDVGKAGKDDQSGAGVPSFQQIENANTPGIYDAAVTYHDILPPDSSHPYGQVGIVVQNQGTETLLNTTVNVSTGGGVTSVNLSSLSPGNSTTAFVPITLSPSGTSGFTIESQVQLSGGLIDTKPSNDRRVETYVPAGSQ